MSRRIRPVLVWLFVLVGESVVLASAGVADVSSPSVAVPQCAYSLGSTSASFLSTGFTGASVSVITGTSCSWTATSNAAWLTVTAATGTGLSAMTYNVAPNTTGSTRVGTITVAGITFTVTQAGSGCAYSLGSTSATFPPTGFTGAAVSVTTGTSCSWTATSNAAWLTITAGATGTGLSAVTYNVAPNTTGSTRVGTLTIAGITFTVTQSGSACTYSLGSTSASVPAAASSGSVSVVTISGCAWSAASNAAWITVTGGASGSGSGSVSYSVAANSTTGSRIGTLIIAGRTFSVTQAAATPPRAPTNLRIVR